MKIKDIPFPALRELALEEQERQGNERSCNAHLTTCKSEGNFDLNESKLGEVFWECVSIGHYTAAREIYDWDNPQSERVFESGSKRDNDSNKPLVDHLDPYLRLRFGVLLRQGANKYGIGNWKLGQPDETALESLHRHLAKYELNKKHNLPQDEDHLSAIIFNVQLLMMNEERKGIKYDEFNGSLK